MSEVPESEVKDAEDFRHAYATGVFGGLLPMDAHMTFHLDRPLTESIRDKPGQEKTTRIVRERLLDIHMTPTVWKQIARWMQEHVERYEKTFGTIPEAPKDAKGKKRPSQIYG